MTSTRNYTRPGHKFVKKRRVNHRSNSTKDKCKTTATEVFFKKNTQKVNAANKTKKKNPSSDHLT